MAATCIWRCCCCRLVGAAHSPAAVRCREKQYDLRLKVPVYTAATGARQPRLVALTFVATADRAANPNFLGPAPLEEVARQIATARGPSGPNSEYLFRLADAMRGMGVQDEELFVLEVGSRCVRYLRCMVLPPGTAARYCPVRPRAGWRASARLVLQPAPPHWRAVQAKVRARLSLLEEAGAEAAAGECSGVEEQQPEATDGSLARSP